MILDGFGIAKTEGNAIAAAKRPNLDKLFSENPITKIGASGMDVGLPDGQMGNSEVGHTNIGAGRIVYQELTRITKAVQDGSFFENEALVHAMNNAKENGTALHLIGLLSNGGVHSHNQHLYGLLEMAKKMGVENVYVHALLDGRDVPPSSGKDFVKELMEKMKEIGVGKVATVMGRYYAMDRDNRWERVEKAYNAMVCREGEEFACPVCAVSKSYENEVTDEFVVPCVIKGGAPVASGDSVVFFNFRPDRAREITRTFVDPDFTGFTRKNGFFPLTYVCMTQYDATMPNVEIAFKPQSLKNTLGEYVSDKGLKQLRIAETEKYAHVTFFFNGGVEQVFPGEDRVLIPSPKVATYDLQPEMSAYAVTEEAVRRIAGRIGAAIELDQPAADDVPVQWHPGRAARVMVGDVFTGWVGELHPRVNEALGFPAHSAAFELNLTALFATLTGKPVQAKPISTFPPVKQDLAFTVDETVTAGQLENVIRKAAGANLESIELFDVFTGEQVGEGKKSLAYAVVFRSPSKTLSAEDSDAIRKAIVAEAAEIGAQLRA